ncbi:MAG: hypothetical protein ACPGVG_18940 [Mycobacterium sp.]
MSNKAYAIVPTAGTYGSMEYVRPVETHDVLGVAISRAKKLTVEYRREMAKFASGQTSGYRVVLNDECDEDGEWIGSRLDHIPSVES